MKFTQQGSDHLKSHCWPWDQRNTKLTKGCNILSCHKPKMERQEWSTSRRGWISQCCCMAVTCWYCWKLHAEVKESLCWMIPENKIMGWHRWCEKIQDRDCCWPSHSSLFKSELIKSTSSSWMNQCWWFSNWWQFLKIHLCLNKLSQKNRCLHAGWRVLRNQKWNERDLTETMRRAALKDGFQPLHNNFSTYVWHQKNQRIWPVHRLKDHVFHRCIGTQESWVREIWVSLHQEDEIQIDSSNRNHHAFDPLCSLMSSMSQGRVGWFLYFLTFPLYASNSISHFCSLVLLTISCCKAQRKEKHLSCCHSQSILLMDNHWMDHCTCNGFLRNRVILHIWTTQSKPSIHIT